MTIDEFLEDEKRDAGEIYRRLRHRDFSGNAGIAVKNSTYVIITTFLIKIGALLFTFIIARLLLEEQFGLYSLALSTIFLLSSLSDFGIGQAILTFLPKELAKGKIKKARGYLNVLFKFKIVLLILSTFLLITLGYLISEYFYQKPIYYAILAGIIYIIFSNLLTFIEQVARANNNFKITLYKEIIFQGSRLLIVPLALVFVIKFFSNYSILPTVAILALSVSIFISLLYQYFALRIKNQVFQVKGDKLSKREIKSLKNFIFPLTGLIFAGIFFGYIDTIMLGRYVSAEFISYYSVAFALVGSLTSIISFASISLFPIFSSNKGKRLEKIFKRAMAITLIISVVCAILTYLLASFVINLTYGPNYTEATPLLKLFSILVIIIPFTSMYDSFFTSQKKTKLLASLLVFTTVLNIIFNFVGIVYGLKIAGEYGAVMGVTLATIASKIIYIGGLVFSRRKFL